MQCNDGSSPSLLNSSLEVGYIITNNHLLQVCNSHQTCKFVLGDDHCVALGAQIVFHCNAVHCFGPQSALLCWYIFKATSYCTALLHIRVGYFQCDAMLCNTTEYWPRLCILSIALHWQSVQLHCMAYSCIGSPHKGGCVALYCTAHQTIDLYCISLQCIVLETHKVHLGYS